MQAFVAKTVMPACVAKPSVKERRRHGKESAGIGIPWFSCSPASGRAVGEPFATNLDHT
jgi:hypothetical protein